MWKCGNMVTKKYYNQNSHVPAARHPSTLSPVCELEERKRY